MLVTQHPFVPPLSLVQVSADKKLKKAALDNALVTLADPSKAAKVDPVSEVFAQYWKQKAIDTEKNKNKVCYIVVHSVAAVYVAYPVSRAN